MPLMASTVRQPSDGEDPAMLARPPNPDPPIRLRIVVLYVTDGVWCGRCGLPCAVTAAYVLEEPVGGTPTGVHRLTYCPTCEGE
jgi:hypothetical protein